MGPADDGVTGGIWLAISAQTDTQETDPMATPAITIYTTAFCPYCMGAKQLLGAKGVAFDEIKVDGDREARATMTERAGGQTTVPQIFVGDTHIGGCNELYALDNDGKLDALLQGGSIDGGALQSASTTP